MTAALLSIAELAVEIERERMRGNTVALVNGVFDLLHAGHARLLSIAARDADIVIVALDTDLRVRETKGPTRPINSLRDRSAVIASIRWVNYVTTFGSLQAYHDLLDAIRPDLLVKGTEYQGREIVGAEKVPRIVFAPRTHSSSEILARFS